MMWIPKNVSNHNFFVYKPNGPKFILTRTPTSQLSNASKCAYGTLYFEKNATQSTHGFCTRFTDIRKWR